MLNVAPQRESSQKSSISNQGSWWTPYAKCATLIATSTGFAWLAGRIWGAGSSTNQQSTTANGTDLAAREVAAGRGPLHCALSTLAGAAGTQLTGNPLFLAMGLSSCVTSALARPSLKGRELPQPILGQGYSDDTQAPARLQCFEPGPVTQIKNPANELKFGAAVDYSQIENALHIDMSSKVSIGPFQGGASASYLRDVKKTAYKVSLHWFEKSYLAANQSQPGTNVLNHQGSLIYNTSKPLFRLYCGDQVITETHAGIGLYAALQLQFSARAAKEIFEQSAGGAFGDIVSASESSQSIVTQNQLSGALSVFAYQQGGDVSQLAEIFGTNSSSNSFVVSCLFGDWDDCGDVIKGVLNYAENILPKQKQTPHIIGYNKVPVELFGLSPGSTTVNATVEAARRQVGELYFNQTAQLRLVDHILGSSFLTQYIPYSTQENLADAQTALASNVATLTDDQGAISCYIHPRECPDILSNLQQQMNPVNTSLIELFSQGYRMKSAAYKANLPPRWCRVIPRCCSAQPGGVRTGWLCPTSDGTYQFQTNEDGATAPWNLVPINATTIQLLQGQTNCGEAAQLAPPPHSKYGVSYSNPVQGDACSQWLHPNTCITSLCGCTGSMDVWPLDHNPC